jgi:hypothetical protein
MSLVSIGSDGEPRPGFLIKKMKTIANCPHPDLSYLMQEYRGTGIFIS